MLARIFRWFDWMGAQYIVYWYSTHSFSISLEVLLKPSKLVHIGLDGIPVMLQSLHGANVPPAVTGFAACESVVKIGGQMKMEESD